ncbi:MAG: methyltransferase domain-containing protein [Spirochaetales bacterium]|nr:methyltransferase domain-containing protein [Spirochaetales bacterium]
MREIFSILRCVNCRGKLEVNNTPKGFIHNPAVDRELLCASCAAPYPVFQGVPVMFTDPDRIRTLIDATAYKLLLHKTEAKMQEATHLAGDELRSVREGNDLLDALGWEIFFWERWKQFEGGFLESTREKIEEYLENDSEGGGRLAFFRKVLSFNGDISAKRLLNIGAGRDYLLEKFLDKGCEVIEQDIVLESLVLLKNRGARLCVCCDARKLPFADNAFDMATSFNVLHHIWPVQEPVGELLRVTNGNIHCNEPNYFALIRLGLVFPGPLRRRLKKFYAGGRNHSPYEDSINPYLFKRIVAIAGGVCADLAFAKDSWIAKQSFGVKKILRIINLILVNIVSLTSAHFDAVIRKKVK